METTKTVSSPAIVPIAECNLPDLLALSKLPAKNAAAPGGVLTTARLALESIEATRSLLNLGLLWLELLQIHTYSIA